MVVEPSGKPTKVPRVSFLVSVLGIFGVKRCMVAHESSITNTILGFNCMLVVSLQLLVLKIELLCW